MRPKRITQAKVDRARDALIALTECVDFGVYLHTNHIHGAIADLVGIFPGHR